MHRSTRLLATATSLALLVSFEHAAAEPAATAPAGIARFTRHPRFVSAKISPRGSRLAATSFEGGKRTIAFIDLASRKFISQIRPESNTVAGNLHWVNDKRVVVELVEELGYVAAPVSHGELYAVDADGGSPKMVFGYRAGQMQTGSHIRKGGSDLAWGSVVDTLRNDERRVLIETRSMVEVSDRIVDLHRLDTYSGVKTLVTRSPIAEAGFVTDENGEPRIAVGYPDGLRPRFFLRDPGGDWGAPSALAGLGEKSEPVRFASGDRAVYVVEPEGKGFALVRIELATGTRAVVSRNELVPPSGFVSDHATGRIVAVEYEPDLPLYDFVDPSHPLSRAIAGLQVSYPDAHVRLLSSTNDASKAVVLVFSDRDPGRILLVDVEKLTAEPIVEVRPWIRPDEMSETAAFHIAASDGLRIHGYVTSPRKALLGSPPPLVVLPHGGPHSVRDGWGFDPVVQLLASEGFAVLQVNYRGSGGYGRAYEEAGYRRWGDRVIDDIVDATRFVVRKGFAAEGRICSFGASFGAYAAMQSAIRAPDLFRCAVGYAGLYDPALMSSEGDIRLSRRGRRYLKEVVGEDEAELRRASPVQNAAALRARVLLVHGEEDRRTPLEHARSLRDALKASGNPPEWLVESKEGHGFYDEAARERAYARIVGFLRENTTAPTP